MNFFPSISSKTRLVLIGAGATGALSLTAWAAASFFVNTPVEGSDLNNFDNAFIQPTDPALSGGGRDQTLQFGDVVFGNNGDDVLIGNLGIDVLSGWAGNDTIIGGTEHFNPLNRDRAFGGEDSDAFLWSPGDGSDFFDGGPGVDAVVFGLMGELDSNGNLVFQVSTDEQAGNVYINNSTGLPLMDITNSPGFCEVIDDSTSSWSAQELDDLGLDHLVRFFIRSAADSFEAGQQNTDNGLRVTLHLKNVEVLVCTSRDGGTIEAFNLTVSPPQQIPLNAVFPYVPQLQYIVQ